MPYVVAGEHSLIRTSNTVDPLQDMSKAITKQDLKLSCQNNNSQSPHGHNNKYNLRKQLEQTNAAAAREGAPGLNDADLALTADDSGSSQPTERAVEGDDGLVFFREHGGGNADHDDCSWDLEANEEGKGEEDSHECLCADGVKIYTY
jgi:hypothetical protein